ncbi:MAG: hypothetical protein K2G49_03155 [Muribaculum sp.]|nr:hypothetical protein [Muribaculum sp.]
MGSVGASGSSPALRPACPQCVYFGRPPSRPYSYAVRYRALSVMVYTGSVGASGSSPALRPACPQCVCRLWCASLEGMI